MALWAAAVVIAEVAGDHADAIYAYPVSRALSLRRARALVWDDPVRLAEVEAAAAVFEGMGLKPQ